MIQSADDVDAILAAPKRLVGQTVWRRGASGKGERDTVAAFKVQLEVGGTIRTDVQLVGNTVIHLTPQPTGLVLICGQFPVDRLDLWPRNPHVNPAHKRVPAELRGTILHQARHQWHEWSLNRDWPLQGSLKVARLVEGLDSLEVAFQSFLARLNIAGTLPLPPHEPRLVP